jgi:hypothetical protein
MSLKAKFVLDAHLEQGKYLHAKPILKSTARTRRLNSDMKRRTELETKKTLIKVAHQGYSSFHAVYAVLVNLMYCTVMYCNLMYCTVGMRKETILTENGNLPLDPFQLVNFR